MSEPRDLVDRLRIDGYREDDFDSQVADALEAAQDALEAFMANCAQILAAETAELHRVYALLVERSNVEGVRPSGMRPPECPCSACKRVRKEAGAP